MQEDVLEIAKQIDDLKNALGQCKDYARWLEEKVNNMEKNISMEVLVAKIKSYMKKYNFSMNKMAKILDIDRSTLTRLFKGTSVRLTALTIEKILNVVGDEKCE